MRYKKLLFVFVVLLLLFCVSIPLCVQAVDHYIDPAIYYYENPDTGYVAAVQDNAWIYSEEQKKALIEKMAPITEYGNAYLLTVDENIQYGSDYALQFYTQFFGGDSGIMVMEQLSDRTVHIWTFGETKKVITSSEISIITDDVSKYAADGDFEQCAEKTFSEVGTVLSSGKVGEVLSGSGIGRPLKFIGCFFIAFILSFFINFMIVRMHTRKKDVTAEETIMGLYSKCRAEDYYDEVIATRSVYSPLSGKNSGSGRGRGGSSIGMHERSINRRSRWH